MVYDYAASPDHFSIRASRLNYLHDAGFLPKQMTPDQVAAENRNAFEQTLDLLLDRLEAEGADESKH